jgi:hypothetical protein
MGEEVALLLVGSAERPAPTAVQHVLNCFGVECEQMAAAAFWTSRNHGSARIFCSAAAFLELALSEEADPGDWSGRIHSAFVFASDPDTESVNRLARLLADDPNASVIEVGSNTEWSVSEQLPEICRSMSGVRVTARTTTDRALVFAEAKRPFERIISTGAGDVAFCRVEFRSILVFLSTADVIDVSAPVLGRVFDIRLHFLSSVPVVLFIKWALRSVCWQEPPETSACLVIDDPLLRPRYGFLDFDRLRALMERLAFSTTVAFIPWNWNRSSPKTVQLFHDNPHQFSVCIHGCDHTRGEYGSNSLNELVSKSRQAIRRMDCHQAKNGLPYDKVMVFPQGVFSEAAMEVLKRSAFMAVVNSEVLSADPQPRVIKIRDYWDVAVMSYREFPIFTRRYPWAGVENFAFDILLGKPCIVAVHHNDCKEDCRYVAEFIERLKKLNVRLRWTSLAEVVRGSFRHRELSSSVTEVEVYGSEVRMRNTCGEKKVFRFRKRELAPAAIGGVHISTHPVDWNVVNDRIEFHAELTPQQDVLVSITSNQLAAEDFKGDNLYYSAKVMLRRYLCEIRDNYRIRRAFSQ